MNKRKGILGVWGLVCVLSFSVFAQQDAAGELGIYVEKYPGDNAVFLKRNRQVDISRSGDSLVVVLDIYEELLILDDNALHFARDRVYTSSFNTVTEIEAYTLIPDKKKYKKVPVTEFKESYDKDTYVFFDDSRLINFTYPQLQKGCKAVLHYKQRVSDPRLMGLFFFDYYFPTVEVRYSIVTDPGIVLTTREVRNHELEIDSTRSITKTGRIETVYSSQHVPKLKYESNNPPFDYLANGLYCTVSHYQDSQGREVRGLAGLDDLYSWYRTFIAGLGTSAEIDSLAKQITKGADTELEKVKKIFYWVQQNIKYIAFEQGMRGLIPHPADYVYDKRYGDCKDMSSLLVSLLKSAGIESHYTWIGSRDLPYRYTEFPAPIVDNHMIAMARVDGQPIYLDATGQYTLFGLPTSMIQGKECLIETGDTYEIKEIPVISKENNLMIDTAFITLEKGKVSGKGSLLLTGYVKVFNTYQMIQTKEKAVDDYMTRLLSRGSNKFFVTDYTLSHVADLDQPIDVRYEFEIGDYYKEIGNEIYLNLILDKSLIDDFKKDRQNPIENDYKYINRSVTKMNIPDGYHVKYLPKNESYDSDVFGFTITYQLTGNQLTATKTFYVDYLMMMPHEFKSWDNGIKTYSTACRQAVIFEKNQ